MFLKPKEYFADKIRELNSSRSQKRERRIFIYKNKKKFNQPVRPAALLAVTAVFDVLDCSCELPIFLGTVALTPHDGVVSAAPLFRLSASEASCNCVCPNEECVGGCCLVDRPLRSIWYEADPAAVGLAAFPFVVVDDDGLDVDGWIVWLACFCMGIFQLMSIIVQTVCLLVLLFGG